MDISALTALARGGLVSTATAEQAGFDRRELAVAARRGQLARVGTGWYAVTPPKDRREAHRLRAAAALIARPTRAASHHTGLILRDLPTFRAPLETVQVVSLTVPRRSAAGVRIRPVGAMHCEQVPMGQLLLPCLPVATCIVQSGLIGIPESALVSADAALAAGSVSSAELAAALDAAAGQRGIRELRRVLAWVDARHESPGESRMSYSLHRLGHPHAPQVWIGNDRVDALLTRAPVVMEFDGALKYDDRRTLIAEKRREDRIRARGYEFVRCGWDDVGDLERLDRAISAAVRRTHRVA